MRNISSVCRRDILFIVSLSCVFHSMPASTELNIFLTKSEPYYTSLEPKSYKDLHVTYLPGTEGKKGERTDQTGELEMGLQLIVLQKAINQDGELYYQVKHPDFNENLVWIQANPEIVTSDPRLFFDMMSSDGRTFRGFIVCNASLSLKQKIDRGSLLKFEIVDEVLGETIVPMQECQEMDIKDKRIKITIMNSSGQQNTLIGKIFMASEELLFITGNIRLDLNSSGKEYHLKRVKK
jgi:hypothetical protein